MNETICEIYEKRPEGCKSFPTSEFQIQDFKSCTYTFKDGVREGKCCGCGECCACMPWSVDSVLSTSVFDLTAKTVDGFIKTDPICRFLKAVTPIVEDTR